MKLNVPAKLAIVLALVGGVAQVVNYSVVPATSELHGLIALAITFIVGVGIPPLTGAKFRATLHLPDWAYGLIGAGLATAQLTLTSVDLPASAHEAIAAVVVVLLALGFSPSSAVVV